MTEEKTLRIGAVVRETGPTNDRLQARVRGILTGFVAQTGDRSHVRVIWPWKPDGRTESVEEILPVEAVQVEAESVAMLTKRLIAGEELAKQELGIEILNKLAEGKGLQEIKEVLEAWDIPVPHRKFRAKVTCTFMAEGTYLGGRAVVNQQLMTEGFRVNDDSSTEILVSMADDEWGSVVLDDPYLTINEFEEIEQEKEQ